MDVACARARLSPCHGETREREREALGGLSFLSRVLPEAQSRFVGDEDDDDDDVDFKFLFIIKLEG